jgi:Ca-activated chloride channel family protein
MRRIKVLLAGITLLGGALLTARAQTTSVKPQPPQFIEPPVPPIRWPQPSLNKELQLETQNAKVRINGAAAEVSLKQTFRNTSTQRVEGTYLFPLPPGAAISDFAMTINGKRTAAEILDKDKAREIYDGIVRTLRDPAILEFVGRDVVQAHIFPIDANGKVDIEMKYSQPLRVENNSFRFDLPLRLPLGGVAKNSSVDIEIQSNQGIRAIYSPTHQIKTSQSGNHAKVSGEWQNQGSTSEKSTFADDSSSRDFVLYYTTSNKRVGINLITSQTQNEDGYFMMLLAPDPDLSAHEIATKDVVFVFDTSGSMSGEKIEQARNALHSLLGNLNPDDRFNIITFSSDVKPWKNQLVSASKNNLDAARDWIKNIKAVGGTNIDEALQNALEMMQTSSTRPQQIIFLTDGQPTVGQTDVSQILQDVRNKNSATSKTRLFSFGVGYDVNTLLLDSLADENRGSTDYVLPSENIEEKVGALYAKIAYPVLTNPRLDWGDANVFDVYPSQLPDIFRGSQTIVFGRFKGKSTFTPQLSGTVEGKTVIIKSDHALQEKNSDASYLPRLWAMRKVGFLMDSARRSNKPIDPEVRAEIIALSKQYGIVTPLTAGLITEDNNFAAAPNQFDAINPSFFKSNRGVPGPMGASAAPKTYSGQSAVAASQATGQLRRAEQVKSTADVRVIEGKTFEMKEGIWTDAAYDPKKMSLVKTIVFGSNQYFDLARDPKVAKWLSVGEKVLLVVDGKAIRVQ